MRKTNWLRLLAVLSGCVVAYLGYVTGASWKLRALMGARAGEAGCSLSYSATSTWIPGRFLAENVRLNGCAGDSWSLSAPRVAGAFSLLGLLRGQLRLKRVHVEAEFARVWDVELSGRLSATVQHPTVGSAVTFRRASLTLREGALRQGNVELQLPLGMSLTLARSEGRSVLDAVLDAAQVSVAVHRETLVELGDVEARVRVPLGRSGRSMPVTEVTLRVQSLAWPALELTLGAPLLGTFQLLRSDAALRQWELGGGRVSATVLAHAERLPVELRVEKLLLSRAATELRAEAAVQGADTAVLLELLALPESLKLTFAGLEGVAFELRSRLSYELGRVSLHDMRLRARGASLVGHLVFVDGSRQGKLLLGYRGMQFGLDLSGVRGRMLMDPPAGWLRAP